MWVNPRLNRHSVAFTKDQTDFKCLAMISVHFREQKREDHLAGVYTIMLLNLKDALRDVRVYE